MRDSFWFNKADKYSEKKFEINELSTHPALVKLFDKYNKDECSKILDFGCGDGSLIKKMDSKINLEVDLYDISSQMINMAIKNLYNVRSKHKLNFMNELNMIKDNYYDCAFLSMVLICIDSEIEVKNILRKIYLSLKENALLFVANPHPCFRDKSFSSYYTAYTIGKKFNYFADGDKHEVFIRDTTLSFFDFNWSLSKLIGLFLETNFELVEFKELNDNNTNEYYNSNVSPSVIYVLKKK